MRQIILTTLLLTINFALSAQPPHGGDNRGERVRIMQCNQIINALNLNGSKQKQFTQIYMDYINESKELRTPLPAKSEEKPSQEEIEAMMLNSFDMSIKSIELKREYYIKFRTILSPREIQRMYNLERNIRDRAFEELILRGVGGNERGGERGGESRDSKEGDNRDERPSPPHFFD